MNTCKLTWIQGICGWMRIASLVGILGVAGCQRGESTVLPVEEDAAEVVAMPDEPTATVVDESAALPDESESAVPETVDETVATDGAPSETIGPVMPSKADQYLPLVGGWIRTDSPYRIEIRGVGRDGRMEAAYFNPKPINVSRAVARNESGQLQVFVELRDVNYPGATYTLAYHREQDSLQGVYYQPAMGQSFDVSFARQAAEGLR